VKKRKKEPELSEISPEALLLRIQARKGFQLIDVRETKEAQQGWIPSALLIPLYSLDNLISSLDKKLETVVYCARGTRGRAAALYMNALGFQQVRNLAGGLERWCCEGHGLEGDPQSLGTRRAP
jgi:rhodanese-related sulfurtransferase